MLAIVEEAVASMRVCKTCSRPQEETEFYWRSDGHLDLHCKECFKARQRRYDERKRRQAGVETRWRARVVVIDGEEVLQCSDCLRVRPTREFYKSPRRTSTGYLSRCRDCWQERCREHHHATYQPRQRKPGRTLEERRAANRERLRREAAEDPERFRLYTRRRAARKLSAPVNDLTAEQWAEILTAYDCCAYCGAAGPLTQDHVVPLSRGGGHTADNVVPACKSCNSRKRTRTPEEWAAKGGPMVDLSLHPFARKQVS